jgi:hypothetical protein
LIKTPGMSKPVEIKTKQTTSSVMDFVNSIEDVQKRADSLVVLQLMEKATRETPRMWGTSLIGFGHIRVKSPTTGREVDWFKMGFSPRKAKLSLHLGLDVRKHAERLEKLGKHKTGVGCLYINKLEDVDVKTLEKIINSSAENK